MRGIALLILSVLAVTALVAAFALTTPDVVLTTMPPSSHVHVPGLGTVPADPGEHKVTVRFRTPEALLAFGAAAVLAVGAAYAAYSERDAVVRRAIATAGMAYGLGITLLTQARRDFRTAAPLLLPLALSLLALSGALGWMLRRRLSGPTPRRRAPSSRGRRPSFPGLRSRRAAARRERRGRRHLRSRVWGPA